jgi:preprotein translocase subunit SecA
MVLHSGKIAEMQTGEGKTIAATLPAYLNALCGQGVHIVTVNDYLALRDSKTMGKIYDFLGLSTGVVISGLNLKERKVAYSCDITYGTNNEFGFDYLRDNMSYGYTDVVQRSHNFVIIDEIDSILIDEARTPLIISGLSEDSSNMYLLFDRIVKKLVKQQNEDINYGDFYVDEKSKQAYLTDLGYQKVEKILLRLNIISTKNTLYTLKN